MTTVTAAGHHRTRLAWALALAASVLLVEVAGAVWSGSLALLADAGHVLTDMAGLGLSLFAVWAAQRPPNPAHTYGFLRTEILAALVNGAVLFGVAGAVLYEAIRRLWAPPGIHGGAMLAVALVGLVVNLIALTLLHEGADTSLNVRSAYLEVLSDAIASVGVVVAAVVIRLTGFAIVDPLVSGAIALFILPRTWRLLRQAVHVLMEGMPLHLDIDEIRAAMLALSGVRSVHDLHVWTLTSGRDTLSAHVEVDSFAGGQELLDALQTALRERFGIAHTTLQLETAHGPLVSRCPAPEPSAAPAASAAATSVGQVTTSR
jgi:cobalt-zinc-cadmium efflux system protein